MGLGHCIQVNIAFAVYRFLHTYPHRRVSLEYLPIVASPYYLGILSLPTHIDHTNYIPIIYFLRATYNHLGSLLCYPVHAWYPRFYAGLCCAGVPRHYVSLPPFFYLREKKYHRVEFRDRVASRLV